MALRDLVAEKGALDEAVIERIVGDYVRFDVEAKAITFLPAFAGLSNKAKILVYLIALQGWKFIIDETIPSDARPGDIEAVTGIPGGSLRPILRSLSENHVLSEKNSRYSVRGTSLHAIEAELNGDVDGAIPRGARPAMRRARRRGRGAAREAQVDADIDIESDTADEGSGAKRVRKIAAKTGSLAATFDRWIDEGYFDEPRTMAEVQRRFRKQAIMVPQTSLPGYFLAAVRKGRLTRDEVDANGKTVWAYRTSGIAK